MTIQLRCSGSQTSTDDVKPGGAVNTPTSENSEKKIWRVTLIAYLIFYIHEDFTLQCTIFIFWIDKHYGFKLAHKRAFCWGIDISGIIKPRYLPKTNFISCFRVHMYHWPRGEQQLSEKRDRYTMALNKANGWTDERIKKQYLDDFDVCKSNLQYNPGNCSIILPFVQIGWLQDICHIVLYRSHGNPVRLVSFLSL